MQNLTIVTVTYNSSDYIEKFLNSLITSSTNIKEIFIIDNDSSDKSRTEKICKKYVTKFNLTYIQNQNSGFGKSSNIGAKLSSCNYILFINPDTELRTDSISTLIMHAITSDADIIGGKAKAYDKKIHGSVVRFPNFLIGLFEFSNLGKILGINRAHKQFYYDDRQILNSKIDEVVDAVSGGYMLIKRESWKRLGGFDENIFMYLEDVDICRRARDLKMKVFFCPHSIIWHIGGASSQNKYKIKHQAWFDSRKYYIRKHLGILENILIQPIYSIEEIILKIIKKL